MKKHMAAHILDDLPEQNKEAFTAAIYMTIQSVRHAFPDLDDATLGKICEIVANLVSGFGNLPVSELNHALRSMFNAYLVASASLEGLIDPGDTPEHIRQMVEEVIHEASKEDDDDDTPTPYTGFYL